MKTNRSIVNVSSIAGLHGNVGQANCEMMQICRGHGS